jgi:4-hydroxy-3-methylbut-2-en-1-yl diphosphate reductase
MSPATVCTPLRVEQLALRGVLTPPPTLTGMGPARSAKSAARLGAATGILVAGLGGAVQRGLQPGDVVVGTEVRGMDGRQRTSASAPLLTAALRRLGLTVHPGPVTSAPGVVHGAGRAALAATGALAVDMESAELTAGVGTEAFAVLRAIVDTPDHPLLRPATVTRGIAGLRSLRAAGPAIEQWTAAVGRRDVVLAAPRSFCAGVSRAIEIVERSLQRHGAPVYVRRQIVHNAHVVRTLERRGAIFVDEVEDVPPGSLVVLAAHGVAPQVRRDAAARGLRVIDATCPLVTKVHSEVRRYAARGDTILLIGHRDHEEVVGTVGEAPRNVLVVDSPADAEVVQVADPERVAYVMQTTLAADEAAETAHVLRQRFPQLAGPRRDDICYATTNRQQAVRAIAGESDLVLVVGSGNSSNSLRLVEVAERLGTPAYLVDGIADVDLRWLQGKTTIGITAGASAPEHLVDEILTSLAGLGPVTVRESQVVHEDVEFTLPKEVI